MVCDLEICRRAYFRGEFHKTISIMTRLWIGVPGGRIAFPPLFLLLPRHSCEGRNLNQGMGVFGLQDCIPHQSGGTEWTEWTERTRSQPYKTVVGVPRGLAQDRQSYPIFPIL